MDAAVCFDSDVLEEICVVVSDLQVVSGRVMCKLHQSHEASRLQRSASAV